MDIQPAPISYNDDLCISTLLINSENDQTLTPDENFALELQLQEAIVSSFTTPRKAVNNSATGIEIGESSKKGLMEPPHSLCEICADIKDDDEMFPLEQCIHNYCKECISKHVSIQLEKRRTVITCPGVDCRSVLEIGTCGEIVRADVRRTWDEVLSNKDKLMRERGEGDERERGDLMLHDLAKEKKWQRCPNCKFYVDKMEGCLHMTCRCQFQFCYACGEAWSSTHGGCQ
ncbi:hypothetical protein ACS0TY_021315 [Phlomoides rotata]